LAEVVRAERTQSQIDIKSIREGEIIGDHEVVFDSPWDTIKISHSAKTRDIFARGALEALKFVAKKKKGMFTMSDVLKELKR
jgi:4-hydroxy-tetrahydrodipicolinate reductase